VTKTASALNSRKKAIKGSRVLVLGISYKKNIDYMRESPAVRLMEILRDKGAKISYSDPHMPIFPKMREYHFNLRSVQLSPEELSGYDLVLIATNHDEFDCQMILRSSKLIVDTRGVFLDPQPNVLKA
jgi:UDP-N-acetyl-D-glucosamine dehydrogenase